MSFYLRFFPSNKKLNIGMCIWRQSKTFPTNDPTSEKLANRSMLTVNDDQDHVPMVKWYQKKTFLRLLLSGCIVAGVVGLRSLHSYCNRNRALLAVSLDDGKLDPSKLQTFANKVLGQLALSETKDVTEQNIRQELNGLVLNAKMIGPIGAKYFEIYLGETDSYEEAFMSILSMKINFGPDQWCLHHAQKCDEFTGSEIVDLSDQVFTALNAKKVRLNNDAHIPVGGKKVHLDFMKIVDPRGKPFKTFYGARGYTCNGADDVQVAKFMKSIHDYKIAHFSSEFREKFDALNCDKFGPCMKKILDGDKGKFASIYLAMYEDTVGTVVAGPNKHNFPPGWKELHVACQEMSKNFVQTTGVGDPCDHDGKCQGDLICEEYEFEGQEKKICVKDPENIIPHAEELPERFGNSDEDLTPVYKESACSVAHKVLPLVFVHFMFVFLYFYI